MLRASRFVTLLLAGLGLIFGGAHVFELAPKMDYDADLYMRVTSTLYRFFGSVGAVIQVSALVSAGVLAYLTRGFPGFRLALLGGLALLLSLLLWATFVAPVNAAWLHALEASPASAPGVYLELRARWEYGHVAAFIAWLLGYVLLLRSALVDSRPNRSTLRAA